MKQKVKILLDHPLITGSSIIFVGSFIANIFNLIFNYSLGRWFLSPSDFGLISSLNSVFALFAIFPSALTGIFAKFSAEYFARDDKGALNSLIVNGVKITLLVASLIFVILIVLLPASSFFLHVKDGRLVLLVFASVFVAILSALPIGVLQGRMRFYFISFISGTGPLIKILFGISLIILGLKVFGAMIGVFLSFLIPFSLLLVFTFKYYDSKYRESKKINALTFLKEFKQYSLNFFLASLGITIIFNTDIILVRHFFIPIISGQYAALSLMGKSIFYLTAPIYFVFFPLVAYKKEKKEQFLDTLLLAAGIIVLFSTSLSFVYFLFPHLVLQIFFPGDEYKILSSYLGPFSLYILVFSLANLLHTFFLSIGKTEIYKINLLVSAMLIFLIFLFHKTLYQIVGILFFISFLLLALLIIYYRRNGRG